jgi:hypothetical protein
MDESELWTWMDDKWPQTADFDSAGHFGRHAVQFIVRHPNCAVHLVSEYGDVKDFAVSVPVAGTDADAARGMDVYSVRLDDDDDDAPREDGTR